MKYFLPYLQKKFKCRIGLSDHTNDIKTCIYGRLLGANIFEKHFPGDDCALCVPSAKSVACSTEEALKWDKDFEKLDDPSGRSIKKVHKDSY